LVITTAVLALFIYFALAVENDKRWFQNFPKNQAQEYYDANLVNKIASLTLIEPAPPVISFTMVFSISKGDSVAITTCQNLRQMYLIEYQNKFRKFPRFLYQVLNHKLILNTDIHVVRGYCQSIFKIDPTIKSLFQKQGVTGLINQYLSSDSSYLEMTYDLSTVQQNSIAYYLFLNRLIKQQDDYNGTVYFRTLTLPQ
jgi:hypothetical protein